MDKIQQATTSHALEANTDRALRALAAIPERTNLQLGITLCVHGMIISGFLISEEAYFKGMIERVNQDDNAADETKETLTDFMSDLRASLHAKSNDSQSVLPEYIHLQEAKMYPSQGQGMPSYGDALWRGRISSVDGFSLGEILPTSLEGLTYAAFTK
ncbi:MAG TPA: gas vesicle accessory protein GvpU [Leptolyngbyaceae cyanobacterium]